MNNLFVSVAFLTIAISLLSFIWNATYYFWLMNSIKAFATHIHPKLFALGRFDDARTIKLKDIPMLEGWLINARTYGFLNVAGVAIPLILIFCNALSSEVAYIGLWSCLALFLGNLFGLPKTALRYHKLVMKVSGYLFTITTIEFENGVSELTNGTKQSSARTD